MNGPLSPSAGDASQANRKRVTLNDHPVSKKLKLDPQDVEDQDDDRPEDDIRLEVSDHDETRGSRIARVRLPPSSAKFV